ncbi:hypothetical protein JYU34_002617 [Plutella xylostella]|uniref:Secreted protein n=1 Tax=Plutella xylostella TaxID=51655 RepID=A0ABQ7R2S0_PLUXY|nr:hypothetical protein JYU34_002617 [Plutella xylostella]
MCQFNKSATNYVCHLFVVSVQLCVANAKGYVGGGGGCDGTGKLSGDVVSPNLARFVSMLTYRCGNATSSQSR